MFLKNDFFFIVTCFLGSVFVLFRNLLYKFGTKSLKYLYNYIIILNKYFFKNYGSKLVQIQLPHIRYATFNLCKLDIKWHLTVLSSGFFFTVKDAGFAPGTAAWAVCLALPSPLYFTLSGGRQKKYSPIFAKISPVLFRCTWNSNPLEFLRKLFFFLKIGHFI